MNRSKIIIFVSLFILIGCATYYQSNRSFQEYLAKGDFEKAEKALNNNKSLATERNKLLFLFEKGRILQFLEKPMESNAAFEEAYFFTEDYRKNYSEELVALISNPTVKPYVGEDHELVLLHYFKTLNYLSLNQIDEALVECRRINIRLNKMNDQYEKKKNRYKRDAFAMNLMGIMYEASGDINNAFIAYRNSYRAYLEDYSLHFETMVPQQLKMDLLRTMYQMGFYEELTHYENELGMKHDPNNDSRAELVFFWHNGLGPIKEEWSVNFIIVRKKGGVVVFVNNELGLSFPFVLPSAAEGSTTFSDLKFIRVAFPKYIARKPFYKKAVLISKELEYDLELSENITEIAFKTLEDRMIRELAIGLLRLAIKQAAEYEIRKKNEDFGTVISVLNALSEKADTRNWQSLPHSISYARLPLDTGSNYISFKVESPYKGRYMEENFEFNAAEGQTIFHVFNSLESYSPN